MNKIIEEKSCGIVIFRSNQENEREYLVLHYEEGHWDFPKGHVEEGENGKETALRELFEETGINEVEFREGFKEKLSYTYERGGQNCKKEVDFYLAQTQAEKVTLSHEHTGCKWLPFKKAIKIVTYDNAKKLLRKAEKSLNIQNG